MTTQIHDSRPAAIDMAAATGLRPEEAAELRDCIEGVRSGETEYYVLLVNRKQTKSKKRMPGQDYDPDPALVPGAHKGWMIAAPVNKQGGTYIHVYDEARAQKLGEGYGHTRATLQGLQSFKVQLDPLTFKPITRPGPLGVEAPQEPQAAAQAPVVAPVDPQIAVANALLCTAQGMMCMAQAMLAQAQRKHPL